MEGILLSLGVGFGVFTLGALLVREAHKEEVKKAVNDDKSLDNEEDHSDNYHNGDEEEEEEEEEGNYHEEEWNSISETVEISSEEDEITSRSASELTSDFEDHEDFREADTPRVFVIDEDENDAYLDDEDGFALRMQELQNRSNEKEESKNASTEAEAEKLQSSDNFEDDIAKRLEKFQSKLKK